MNSIRKWIFKPKKTDTALLAKFYFADEELNSVASELDSFDGRKEPERCAILVNQLRQHQDSVLSIIEQIMTEVIPNSRARRDYRVKFPDDVLQDMLTFSLQITLQCLAAGSSILNREVESASMRPLARALTQHIDELRSLLRVQCLKNQSSYNEMIVKALTDFDRLFSDFELSYVSVMVPVKTMKDYDLLQDVTVLFCETVNRSMKLGLLNQELLDSYDPVLMFTIPRLAIVWLVDWLVDCRAG
ncbi:hypothetical protein HELRODRAFT_88003 [Helobdella robusta]|uniref:Uncharacterized protein n=1 Tax=Helobdella robusta TaxID=6412 RepID=T1G6X3_HELRO|nr:hypothetical protein HELRODRAFT_88003 [Helobdella robusta]ESN93889.1 hypothetical protein HELRODRAFT_88003 [Helobdella robusta]